MVSLCDAPSTLPIKCGKNAAGIARFFIILYDDVGNFGTIDATSGKYTVAPSGTTGEAFVEWQFTGPAAQMELPPSGTKGGMYFRTTVTIDIPNVRQEVINEVEKVLNQRVMIGIVDNNGNSFIVGSEAVAARQITGGGGTSPEGDNYNGLILNFELQDSPTEYDGNVSDFITEITTVGA